MALKMNQQKTMCSYAILFLVVWLGMAVWNGKFDSSIKMLHQMKQDGLMPDVVTYSTLLAGFIKVKHGYSKALELVRELQHNGLHMDGVIYGTLLVVCASNTKLEEAESYFNWMKDEGHLPNVFHYSSMLNAYSISGNYRKADELVQDMKSAGLFAGACSMAIGEFVSVYTQRDIEVAQMKRENSMKVGGENEEEGEKENLPNPFQAAFASVLAFSVGAVMPLLAAAFIKPHKVRLGVLILVASLALVVFGIVGAVLGKTPKVKSSIRVLVGGWVAMAITFGLTKLIGSNGLQM